uniref:PqiC family protein n=1 Tax=Thaumasiovibrio occultus TaxID=1891184 RepID=UPI000B35331D|nr:ABC-type transport auxiliary lipoprotein family protein [Thaumasiovibrio occultus]
MTITKGLIALGLMVLAGCSSSPQATSNDYLLPINRGEATTITANAPHLVLSRVETADHLSGPGLVYQINDTQIVAANQHTWAESLSEQLARKLSTEIAPQLTHYQLVNQQGVRLTEKDAKLSVRFDQFNGHFSGTVVASGQWTLTNDTGEILMSQRFFLQPTQKGDGYPAMVNALAEVASTLASSIARQINTL